MFRKLQKILSLFLSFTFIFYQAGFAQVAAELNLAGYLGQFHTPAIDKFRPLHLRYFSYDANSNNFRIILDKGDLKDIQGQELKASAQELLNYFLIGISLPDESFWVNLRPDSPENIIDPYLAQTDVGKILLEADLQLKKDTAKFTSPETPEGKTYWTKLYQKAGELFGYENVTIPTLTRPWIVPDEVIIRTTQDSAYVYKATLKVLLEQDHLKNSATYNFTDPRLKALNEYASQIIRETIIPKLTKEVNISKKYAALRQVYYSIVLSRWFKTAFKKGLSPTKAETGSNKGTVPALIDSRNLTNLMSKGNWSKNTYFQEYQKSFKDGEYNLKEPVYTPYGQSIRSYFSGGITMVSSPISGGFMAKPGVNMVAIAGRDPGKAVMDGNSGGLSVSSPATVETYRVQFNELKNSRNYWGLKELVRVVWEAYKAIPDEKSSEAKALLTLSGEIDREIENIRQAASSPVKQGSSGVNSPGQPEFPSQIGGTSGRPDHVILMSSEPPTGVPRLRTGKSEIVVYRLVGGNKTLFARIRFIKGEGILVIVEGRKERLGANGILDLDCDNTPLPPWLRIFSNDPSTFVTLSPMTYDSRTGRRALSVEPLPAFEINLEPLSASSPVAQKTFSPTADAATGVSMNKWQVGEVRIVFTKTEYDGSQDRIKQLVRGAVQIEIEKAARGHIGGWLGKIMVKGKSRDIYYSFYLDYSGGKPKVINFELRDYKDRIGKPQVDITEKAASSPVEVSIQITNLQEGCPWTNEEIEAALLKKLPLALTTRVKPPSRRGIKIMLLGTNFDYLTAEGEVYYYEDGNVELPRPLSLMRHSNRWSQKYQGGVRVEVNVTTGQGKSPRAKASSPLQPGSSTVFSQETALTRFADKLKELRDNSGLPISLIPYLSAMVTSDNQLWREALRVLYFAQPVYRRVERAANTDERGTGITAFANAGVDRDIRGLTDYDVSTAEFRSIRIGEDVRGFISQPNAVIPPEAYFMHRGIFASRADIQKAFYDNKIRFDITVIPPAIWGVDFAKTVGHYHDPIDMPEIYQVVSGEVLWLMQKCDAQGKVIDVITVRAKAGDIAIMLPGYGHVSVNLSETEPLVMADWLTWHQSSYYGSFKEKGGTAYYVVRQPDGTPALVANPEYLATQETLPIPRQMVARDEIPLFGLKRGEPIYNLVARNAVDFAQRVEFLNNPGKYEELLTPEETLQEAQSHEQIGSASSRPSGSSPASEGVPPEAGPLVQGGLAVEREYSLVFNPETLRWKDDERVKLDAEQKQVIIAGIARFLGHLEQVFKLSDLIRLSESQGLDTALDSFIETKSPYDQYILHMNASISSGVITASLIFIRNFSHHGQVYEPRRDGRLGPTPITDDFEIKIVLPEQQPASSPVEAVVIIEPINWPAGTSVFSTEIEDSFRENLPRRLARLAKSHPSPFQQQGGEIEVAIGQLKDGTYLIYELAWNDNGVITKSNLRKGALTIAHPVLNIVLTRGGVSEFAISNAPEVTSKRPIVVVRGPSSETASSRPSGSEGVPPEAGPPAQGSSPVKVTKIEVPTYAWTAGGYGNILPAKGESYEQVTLEQAMRRSLEDPLAIENQPTDLLLGSTQHKSVYFRWKTTKRITDTVLLVEGFIYVTGEDGQQHIGEAIAEIEIKSDAASASTALSTGPERAKRVERTSSPVEVSIQRIIVSREGCPWAAKAAIEPALLKELSLAFNEPRFRTDSEGYGIVSFERILLGDVAGNDYLSVEGNLRYDEDGNLEPAQSLSLIWYHGPLRTYQGGVEVNVTGQGKSSRAKASSRPSGSSPASEGVPPEAGPLAQGSSPVEEDIATLLARVRKTGDYDRRKQAISDLDRAGAVDALKAIIVEISDADIPYLLHDRAFLALERLRAVDALKAIVEADRISPTRRREALSILERLDAVDVLKALIPTLKAMVEYTYTPDELRREALSILERLDAVDALKALIPTLKAMVEDKTLSDGLRKQALSALERAGAVSVLKAMVETLPGLPGFLCDEVLFALSRLGAVSALKAIAENPTLNYMLCNQARDILGSIKNRPVSTSLISFPDSTRDSRRSLSNGGEQAPIIDIRTRARRSTSSPVQVTVDSSNVNWSGEFRKSPTMIQIELRQLVTTVRFRILETTPIRYDVPIEIGKLSDDRSLFCALHRARDEGKKRIAVGFLTVSKTGWTKMQEVYIGQVEVTIETQSASSPTQTPEEDASRRSLSIDSPTDETGGIDFRTMNILAQPMGSFSGLNFELPKLANLEKINLDDEFKQITLMVERGIIPSGERVKEYLSACYYKQELGGRLEDLMLCLIRICKLEEENVQPSDAALRESLVLVDSIL